MLPVVCEVLLYFFQLFKISYRIFLANVTVLDITSTEMLWCYGGRERSKIIKRKSFS